MTKVQEIYLTILRNAIWGGSDVTSERLNELTNERVDEIVRLAAFQGTGALVYDQLLKMKDVEMPADIRMQMKQQCVHSMMLQQSMVPIMAKAWTALEDADIHPVLLKGFGIAQYYPLPHLRQWGDIDLYVGQANYHKACSILREVFPEAKHPEEEYEDYKHYNLDFDNTAIETHRISMAFAHPRDRKYYEQLEAKCLTKDGPTFDCEKLMEVWQMVMWIVTHYLHVPEGECPFYTENCKGRAELLFERILMEGQARQHESVKCKVEGVSYLKRKWMTFKLRISERMIVRPYAPRYARHMVIGDILHGGERIFAGK